MKLFDLLYKVYFLLPNFYGLGIIGKIYRHSLTDLFKFILLVFYKKYIRESSNYKPLESNKIVFDKELIVSLTTYEARIDVVDIAIKTLLRQTLRPNRIILWLARDEFQDKELPFNVLELKKYNVEIRFCDNLLAHKKYYYALKEFKNAYIITFDDDFFYERDMIKNLLNMKQSYPDCVVSNRAHLIKFHGNSLARYREWSHNTSHKKPSHKVFATGGVGTLYENRFFKKSVLEHRVFMKICPYADDVWLKFAAYLNGLKVVTNAKYNKDFITLPESQKQQLIKMNVRAGGNDSQIEDVMSHYKITPSDLKMN